jgi:hypothetical protein
VLLNANVRRYIVEKRHLYFWWKPEYGGYYSPIPGDNKSYALQFTTEKEALKYINGQPNKTIASSGWLVLNKK